MGVYTLNSVSAKRGEVQDAKLKALAQYRRTKLEHRREFRKRIDEWFGYLMHEFGFKRKWVNIDAVFGRNPEIAVQFTKRNLDGSTVGVGILEGDGMTDLKIFYSEKNRTHKKSMHFDSALIMLRQQKGPSTPYLQFCGQVLRKYCVDFLNGDHKLLDRIDACLIRGARNIHRRFVRSIDSIFQFLVEKFGFERLSIKGHRIIYSKALIGLVFHGDSEAIYCTLFNGNLIDGELNENVEQTSIRTALAFRCPTVDLPVGVDGQVILLPRKPLTPQQLREGLEFCARMLREHCLDFLDGDPSIIAASHRFHLLLYGQL